MSQFLLLASNMSQFRLLESNMSRFMLLASNMSQFLSALSSNFLSVRPLQMPVPLAKRAEES
jgi:hypothetical protein